MTNDDARAEERWFRGIDDEPMPEPTPSPAPASGAETPCPNCTHPKHDHVEGLGCCYSRPARGGYRGQMIGGATACPCLAFLPTPPSDAGTSERETPYPPCAYCGGSPWEHEAATTGRTICRQYRSRIVDGAAAPAAEGPRDYTTCGCDGVGMCNEHIVAMLDALPPAALPGAEAGTPDECVRCGHPFSAHGQQTRCPPRTKPSTYLGPVGITRVELAALTSEVRALREDAERWRAFLNSDRISFHGTAGPHGDYAHFGGEFWTRVLPEDANDDTTKRHREFLVKYADAARLASPSPTGAP